ncbi:hypothetical protein PSTG_10814 [Puccinia striiformis f. sp. tritici PST-78]|uniref:Uncharacterized protein n=1 Tax=Puccinia striiformis f. sp. tritici PST-78 TaxID=1165861 RepID=A0A0L0V9D2_9BASI|nr:hypothetical protein PSTG_10814 [Puccinia striiformis f. sp. tritici PST-78]
MPLDFVQLCESHTGKYMAQTVQLVVEKFGIQNKICGIVSNNATNDGVMVLVRELKQLKWPRFKGETPCSQPNRSEDPSPVWNSNEADTPQS